MITYSMQYKRSDTDGYEWWEDVPNLAVPFTIGFTLDETLDSGRANLTLTDNIHMKLHPFTLVKITQHDEESGTDTIMHFFTGTRTRIQKRMGSPVLYDYEIELLELTKILERTYLETITFTQPLFYLNRGSYVTPPIVKQGDNYGVPVLGFPYSTGLYNTEASSNIELQCLLKAPEQYQFDGNGFYMQPLNAVVSVVSKGNVNEVLLTRRVTDPQNPARYIESLYYPDYREQGDIEWTTCEDGIFKPTLNGEDKVYNFRYVGFNIKHMGNGVFYYQPFTIEWNSLVSKTKGELSKWTISQAVQRICSIAYNKNCDRYGNEINKIPFDIDPVFLEEFKNIEAPEFTFTNNTLFEALLKVGTDIHRIPRLTYNNEDKFVLTFDKLGDIGELQENDLRQLEIGSQSTYNIEDYASDLIMPSQQLISTFGDGSIKDIAGAYKTMRTENGAVEINADTAIVKTQFPIYALKKVEMAPVKIKGTYYEVGDITKFLYEGAEYKMLAVDAGSVYPFSKAFALEWNQGSNEIRGFNFQAKTLLNDAQAFQNPAIVNIIQRATGQSISLLGDLNYTEFAFRITYVPIFNARLGQRRFRFDSYGFRNDIIYNQASNIAESSYMSKNIKAAIQRMGNELIQKTYHFNADFNAFNYLGKRIGNLFISNINASFDKDHIQATFTYTKNFNRLNAYTSLNSEIRMYEIDEKRSEKREMLIEKTLLFQSSNTDTHMSYIGSRALSQFFVRQGSSGEQANAVILGCYSKNEGRIVSKVVLPVNKLIYGSSMVLFWEFFDNYGAGFQSDPTLTKSGEKKSVQRLYPYTDNWGRIDYMKIYFKRTAWGFRNTDVEGQGQANIYPEWKWDLPPAADDTLIINKDSREKLTISYQIHYVSEYEELALLEGLAEGNVLMSGYNDLRLIIGQTYDKYIDLTTGQVPADAQKGKIKLCRIMKDFNTIITFGGGGDYAPGMRSIMLTDNQITINGVDPSFDNDIQLGRGYYVFDIDKKELVYTDSELTETDDGRYYAVMEEATEELLVDDNGKIKLYQLERVIPNYEFPDIAVLMWHPANYEITKTLNLMAENGSTNIHGAFNEI